MNRLERYWIRCFCLGEAIGVLVGIWALAKWGGGGILLALAIAWTMACLMVSTALTLGFALARAALIRL